MIRLQPPAFAVAVLVASAAAAQDRGPEWVKRPSLMDLHSVWPARALKEGYGGKATLSCTVTVQGALRACQVVEETPKGGGFGGAALALSPQFMMKPALKGGAPVEATVRIPIAFPTPDKATGSRLRPVTDTDFKGEKVFTNLPWKQAPSHADVLAAYPAKARAEKVSGGATLDCRIDKDGGISACRQLRESPEGYGFGQAARSLSDLFTTPTEDGKGASIAGSRVHLRVSFAAEALDTTSPVIGKTDWLAFPDMEDFTSVISPAARAAKVYKARVVMLCKVVAEDALGDCKVQAEEPAGLGYGASAVALAPRFRVAVWTSEGLPVVGGSIRVPLRFDLEEAMAGAP
jgi:TonB family protein